MKKRVLKIHKIQPLFTKIVCTADKYSKEDAVDPGTGLVTPGKEGTIKNIQKIISLGPAASQIGLKEGDLVSLNFDRFAVRKAKKNSLREDIKGDEQYDEVVGYSLPVVSIDEQDHLFVDSGVVEFVVSDFSYDEIDIAERAVGLITPTNAGGSKLILN